MSYITAEVQERVQEEVLEPNYYLLLFGTSVLNLHSALTSITPSNNLKSWFGAGRRFPNNIKVSPGLGDGSRKRTGVLGALGALLCHFFNAVWWLEEKCVSGYACPAMI